MRKVIIPKRHLEKLESITCVGGFVGPAWVDGEKKKASFYGAVFPVNSKTLEFFKEGTVSFEDKILYTDHDIELDSDIVRSGTKFKVISKKDYSGISNLKIYILKRRE